MPINGENKLKKSLLSQNLHKKAADYRSFLKLMNKVKNEPFKSKLISKSSRSWKFYKVQWMNRKSGVHGSFTKFIVNLIEYNF